ncbi:MAG: hypothetical protein GY754_43215, partial [bacterium]|nr:hypothetical protein [bacterium]
MKKMKKHDTIPGTGAGRNLVSLLAGMALIISIITITSCKTTEVIGETAPDFTEENQKFLEVDEKAREVFRVLLTSDEYTVSQMKYDKLINRSKDPGGDKYMSDEVKRMDTIYAAREGVFTVWIYPDSGKLMQIRPQRSTFIIEADKLIMEDIQRWSF